MKYVYRKHLREPGKYLLFMMVLLLSIVIELGIIYGLKADIEERGIIILVFLGITVMLAIILGSEFLILYFLVFKKFKNVNVTLNDLGITYNNIKGSQFIPYESIQAIQFPSIKYIGGWVKIKSSGNTIRLTVVLEKIGEFINELKDKLDSKGMKDIYNEEKLYNFCKTAVYSDQSWERVYENLKKLSLIYFICIVTSIIYLGFINLNGPTLLYSLLIVLYPFIVFIIAEIILGFKLSNKTKQEGYIVSKRDKESEDHLYKNVFIVIGILTTVLLFIPII